MACPVGGTARPIGETAEVSGVLTPARASISDLSRLEIDAGVDPRISQIGDEIYDDADQRKNIERSEDNRIVAIEDALETQKAKAVERKNRFDKQRPGKKGMHECRRKSGNHDEHGIAEDVAVKDLVGRAAFRARG